MYIVRYVCLVFFSCFVRYPCMSLVRVVLSLCIYVCVRFVLMYVVRSLVRYFVCGFFSSLFVCVSHVFPSLVVISFRPFVRSYFLSFGR